MTTVPQILAIQRIHFVVRVPVSSRFAMIYLFCLGTAPTWVSRGSHTCPQRLEQLDHLHGESGALPQLAATVCPGPWQKSKGFALLGFYSLAPISSIVSQRGFGQRLHRRRWPIFMASRWASPRWQPPRRRRSSWAIELSLPLQGGPDDESRRHARQMSPAVGQNDRVAHSAAVVNCRESNLREG